MLKKVSAETCGGQKQLSLSQILLQALITTSTATSTNSSFSCGSGLFSLNETLREKSPTAAQMALLVFWESITRESNGDHKQMVQVHQVFFSMPGISSG